jgi:CRP-like cAMP-binding protein
MAQLLIAETLMIIEASIFRDLGADGRVMAINRKASFNPKSFLAKVGEGRSIHAYPEAQIVFSQGDSADAVFFLQTGKVKVTVVSKRGK